MVLSVITASGRSSACFRSKWTCRGWEAPLRSGAQWWGRNQADSMLGGAIQPSVISLATFSSQKSGFPFSTEAQLVKHVAPLHVEFALPAGSACVPTRT